MGNKLQPMLPVPRPTLQNLMRIKLHTWVPYVTLEAYEKT
jgi:hypothetical protein